jgi:putative ABC transport system permease protein
MIKSFFTTALRQIWKHKLFGVVNIVGLSLGLSSIMVLVTMVWQFNNFDRGLEKKDRIVQLKTKTKDGKEYAQTTYPLLYEILRTCPEVESGTHLQTWYSPWLKFGEIDIQKDRCYFVDSGFFNIFTYPFKYGHAKGHELSKYNIVLSEETAAALFGNTNPVGKTVLADDTMQLTVTGVLQHIASNNSVKPDVLLSTALLKDVQGFVQNADWYNDFAENYLLLKPGTNRNFLESKIDKLIQLNYHPTRREDRIRAAAFAELPQENMGTIGKAILSGAIGTALFILLIIVANLVNLNAGTMFTRAKEVAVKQMIGSSKKQIILQFCMENILLVLFSLLLATLVFLYLLLPQLNSMFAQQFGELELHFLQDYPLLFIFTGMGILIALTAAAYPAWHLTSLKLTDSIKGKLAANYQKNNIRNVFITLQFALSIVLIYTTVLLNRQMAFMKTASLGFNKDDVAIINLDMAFKDQKSAAARFDALLNDLQTDTRIRAISTNAVIPTAYWNNFNNYYDVTNSKEVNLRHVGADAGYFSTYEIPVIEGRSFNNVPDSLERGNVIINRAAVKAFGWTSAVGKKLKQKNDDATYTVVGVTEDFNYRSLTSQIEPLLHWYSGKQNINNNYLSLLINKGKINDVLAKVSGVLTKIPAKRPFSSELMMNRVDGQYAMLDNMLKMTQFTAFLTIFIACMGMLGLITLFARLRIKEIGVRKVLGASAAHIVLLLSRNFLALVLLAAAIAAPLAWWLMNNWLQDFAYRINIQWWMFAIGALIAIAIVAITVSFQSVKAALSNPVKSLRTE